MKLSAPASHLTLRLFAAASLSSTLLFLSFPPASLFPLAFAAMAPLLWAIRGASVRRAFTLAWSSGALFFILLLHWIVFNPAVEPWVRPLLYLGTLLIGLYLGLFWALPAALSAWLAARSRVPVWLSFPVLMVLSDYLRTQGLLGFPWGSLGYTQARWAEAVQLASLGGIYIVSFWVCLVNGLLLWTFDSFAWVRFDREAARKALPRLFILLLSFLLPPLAGIPMLRATERKEAASPSLTVALIQGNIEQGMRWDRDYMEENWAAYRRLTLEAAERNPDLVVWPETAMPFYMRYENRYFSGMLGLVDSTGMAVLTGVPDVKTDFATGKQDYYNSAFLFLPGRGLAGEYAKAHLVPFGERFPLKDRIPGLKNVNFGEGEWTPGADTVLLSTGRGDISCLICFESIFPGIARGQAARGSRLFVNITNDGWFGRSGAARQHAEMSVFRAVEQRRAVARCANSGISMFVTPSGRVIQPTRLYQRATIIGRLPLMDGRTLYGRFGDLFVLLLLAASGLAFLSAIRRRSN